ncbi:MAG: RdRp [hymenopteran phasma-related virus OKIAV227]|uniref:RdRp n=1 Tax=hymenopteran phasma-related virus OKIAV227 TaxID=2847799 RepID=UPI0024846370|nr:MAG: RdRp [hymenopteran phasma-related virus OKIAV227]WBM84615.1 MAG: RdRp [hymenopteran phasma-related virus OKIAV227]
MENLYRYSDRANKRLGNLNRIDLKPDTPILQILKLECDSAFSKWRGHDPETALSKYLSIRYNRHELWCDYLGRVKRDKSFYFGDYKVSDFVKRLEKQIGTTLTQTPNTICKKSPDILFYNPNNCIIYLGDIAVTNSVESTYRRKYEKYIPIEKYFIENKMRVCRKDFILDETLRGVEQLINSFEQAGIIKYDSLLLEKYKKYHENANKAMRVLSENNTHPKEFLRLLAIADKTREIEDISVEYCGTKMETEDAEIDEDTIIKWIKDETDKNIDDFYDDGYTSAETGFRKLYENFEKQEHSHPKSALKVIYNNTDVEVKSGHDLLEEYVLDIMLSDDDAVSKYLLNMLPTTAQIKLMKNFDRKNSKPHKEEKVFGPWQYQSTTQYSSSFLTMDLREKLQRGKKVNNEKKAPTTISPHEYSNCIKMIDESIFDLGSLSSKPPILDNSWDSKTTAELYNTTIERERYMYCKNTNGAQLGHSLSLFHQRLMHLRTKEAMKDNIFIPPNGSFIAYVPHNHQPLNNKNADVPIIFITRVSRKSKVAVREYECSTKSMNYIYYVSKLCRLPLDKISQWDQTGHKIVACSSFLCSLSDTLWNVKERVVGTLTMLTLDLHQKTSELLDLMKYVSFMPFSDISRLSKLIEDKFNIMLKTPLDVWVIKTIEDFMTRLSISGNVTGCKDKLRIFNGSVMHSSLGMKITIPSFLNKTQKHNKIQDFVEEISMINTVRGKHFYGSQFMDKSISDTAQWNGEYEDEITQYGEWTKGRGEGSYPFDAKFCFSKDAIIHALDYVHNNMPVSSNKVIHSLNRIDYDCYAHKVCTLRGSTKEKEKRKNDKDLHTTALDAVLTYYKDNDYNEVAANTVSMAKKFLDPCYVAQYTMSEKEQRGGGRPIATATLLTKIGNLMIEKPEQAIGSCTQNNILVAGKHKLTTQSNTYKQLLERGYACKKKYVFQCTEDQSKFSENDNTRKYEIYIKNNKMLPHDVRSLQYDCLKKMIGREHLVSRVPKRILETDLKRYMNKENNGIMAFIGWPQGMLNNISTSIHSIADYWITYAYNKAYGANIVTNGLVHSDDSWYAIACDSIHEFKRFSLFRCKAKRLFCLKLNEKKLWGSRLMGELVSNFNINGEVLVPVSKIVANGFGNLLYQNWVIDVHNQISTIQQSYRQGANLGMCVMLSTILRQQIVNAYNVSSDFRRKLHILPIEMGGYPNNSVFEIGVTGVNCHYKKIYEYVENYPNDKHSLCILKVLRMSMIYNKTANEEDFKNTLRLKCRDLAIEFMSKRIGDDDSTDYQNISIPRRAETFSVIQHIIPKSKKITKTVDCIKKLPFETDGLEMLVTKPRSLSEALGHLKSQMNTLLFSLASEKYTSNKKRLAINQSIQATGKTIKICGMVPMTIEEMINFVDNNITIAPASIEMLKASFHDDSNVVNICSNIVNYSTLSVSNDDKRKTINRMPDFEDKYTTICKMQSVLLKIIDDMKGTNYLTTHTKGDESLELLEKDTDLIRKRFGSYFCFYPVEKACNLIMQQYLQRLQPRLWTQPMLRRDDICNFLQDLYGCTLSIGTNFRVHVDHHWQRDRDSINMIDSIYTCEVLNRLYPGSFEINKINDKTKDEILAEIDYSELSHAAFLKYSILQMVCNNQTKYLSAYDERMEYRQYYTIPQQYSHGSYRGKFSVMIQLGNLTMKVEGVPEDLSITVNRPLVDEIVRAMHLFVSRDHGDYFYHNAGSWHTTKFWQSKFKYSNMELRNYGGNNTVIKRTGIDKEGLSVEINPHLIFNAPTSGSVVEGYELDEYLRVAYKIINNRRVRISNVKQDLSCPLSDSIKLVPNMLDGFMNVDLLRTKAIINCTLMRSQSTNLKDIRTLLRKRIPGMDDKIIGTLFCKLISVMSKIDIPVQPASTNILTEVIEIHGTTQSSFIEEYMETAPEDLEGVEVSCLYDEEDRTGALIRHKNLHRLFCKYFTHPLNDWEVENLLYHMCRDHELRTTVMNYCKLIEAGEISVDDIMIDLDGKFDHPIELYSIILANELDSETISKQLLKKVVNQKSAPIVPRIYDLSVALCRAIKQVLGEDMLETDEFASRLK